MLSHPSTMRLAGDAKRSMARKVNFTARTLAAFSLPAGRDEAALYDAKVAGLIWRLRAPDNAGFYFMKRINGRLTRVKIGGRDLTIEQARRMALAMSGDAAEGITPTARRESERAAETTLGDLLARWMEHAKAHKRTWRGDETQIERYLADWKTKRLADIRRDDIRELHAAIGEGHGPYTANRLLALLSAAYSKGGDLWEGPNPAKGVSRFKEQSRDRFLTGDEMPRFFTALASVDDETIRDCIKFSLLSGGRRSNVLSVKWAEIDLNLKTWRIPPEKSKNGKVMYVPLSPPAVELLEARRKVAGADAVQVFPSYGSKGHLIDFRAAWKDVLKKAGLSDFRFHDLRRSLGSWMAISGASELVIGRTLGHLSPASTKVYAHLSNQAIRAGVDLATAAIIAASTVTPDKNGKAGK